MLSTRAASLMLPFLAVAAALVSAERADGDTPVDPVVAVVNGAEIRQSDVAMAFERLPDQFRQVPIGTLFTQIVQQLID